MKINMNTNMINRINPRSMAIIKYKIRACKCTKNLFQSKSMTIYLFDMEIQVGI